MDRNIQETGKLKSNFITPIKINMPTKPFREEIHEEQKPFGLTESQRRLSKKLAPILEASILNRNITV